jgi:hypothetical protein
MVVSSRGTQRTEGLLWFGVPLKGPSVEGVVPRVALVGSDGTFKRWDLVRGHWDMPLEGVMGPWTLSSLFSIPWLTKLVVVLCHALPP